MLWTRMEGSCILKSIMRAMISAIGRVPHLRPGYWMHLLQYIIKDFSTVLDSCKYYPILRSRLWRFHFHDLSWEFLYISHIGSSKSCIFLHAKHAKLNVPSSGQHLHGVRRRDTTISCWNFCRKERSWTCRTVTRTPRCCWRARKVILEQIRFSFRMCL